MKKLVLALAVLALAVPFAEAQKEENLPTELKIITAGDVKVRYLNFKWDEAAFNEMQVSVWFVAPPQVIDLHKLVVEAIGTGFAAPAANAESDNDDVAGICAAAAGYAHSQVVMV